MTRPAFLCLILLVALCGPAWADCDADCLTRFAQCKEDCTGVDRAQCAAGCLAQSESCAALCNPGAPKAKVELPDKPLRRDKAEEPAKTAEETYQEALARAAKTDTCPSFCGGRVRRCVDGCGEGQGGDCAAKCSEDGQVCQAVCYARRQRERREAGSGKK